METKLQNEVESGGVYLGTVVSKSKYMLNSVQKGHRFKLLGLHVDFVNSEDHRPSNYIP